MRSQQFLLCHLLMLAGCSHLAQNNMFSRPNSPAVADNQDHDLDALISLVEDLANALPTSYKPLSDFDFTSSSHHSSTNKVTHIVEDLDGTAILSNELLRAMLPCVAGLDTNSNSHLSDGDGILKRIGVTLTPEFRASYSSIFARSDRPYTPEALLECVTTYSNYAVHIAYLVASSACNSAKTFNNATIPRVHNAAAKATRSVAMLAFTAHLTHALAAEHCAMLHATLATTNPTNAADETSKAELEADKATRAAQRAVKAAQFATDYNIAIGGTSAVGFTDAIILAIDAAAARARASATHAHAAQRTAIHADANQLAATAQLAAVNANTAATNALRNAIARAYTNRDTATLDFELAKTTLDVHLSRIASFNSSTSSA